MITIGVLPSILFLETNQYLLIYISCCGLPGLFEYFYLALYKNDYITLLDSKLMNIIIHNFIRYPLCISGSTFNLIAYKNGILKDNFFMTLYINFLLYINGSIYNYLTLNSYFIKKIKIY